MNPASPPRALSAQRVRAPAVLAAAALLAIASYVTHWATFTFPQTATSTQSVHVGHRSVGLFFGLILLLRAIMAQRLPAPQARRWGGFAMVSGAFIAGYATYDLVKIKSDSIAQLASNTAAHLGLPLDHVLALINRQAEAGLIRVSFHPGLDLAFGAAALALMGGYMSLRAKALPPQDPAGQTERLARAQSDGPWFSEQPPAGSDLPPAPGAHS